MARDALVMAVWYVEARTNGYNLYTMHLDDFILPPTRGRDLCLGHPSRYGGSISVMSVERLAITPLHSRDQVYRASLLEGYFSKLLAATGSYESLRNPSRSNPVREGYSYTLRTARCVSGNEPIPTPRSESVQIP